MHEKNHRRMPWWHEIEPPTFPPPPWNLSRVDGGDAVSWLITSEMRAYEQPPVAIVPHSLELEGEQRAAAYLITAAPALFMGAAAIANVLEDGRKLDAPTRRALEFLKGALDAARGRA